MDGVHGDGSHLPRTSTGWFCLLPRPVSHGSLPSLKISPVSTLSIIATSLPPPPTPSCCSSRLPFKHSAANRDGEGKVIHAAYTLVENKCSLLQHLSPLLLSAFTVREISGRRTHQGLRLANWISRGEITILIVTTLIVATWTQLMSHIFVGAPFVWAILLMTQI